MTLKIEKHSNGHKTTIRLIGRMQGKHLSDLQALITESGPEIVLDLQELTLVDVQAVRFLRDCCKNRVSLAHCARYIRDWIAKEH